MVAFLCCSSDACAEKTQDDYKQCELRGLGSCFSRVGCSVRPPTPEVDIDVKWLLESAISEVGFPAAWHNARGRAAGDVDEFVYPISQQPQLTSAIDVISRHNAFGQPTKPSECVDGEESQKAQVLQEWG